VSKTSADVLIVGGGVIGCAAAYALAREGLDVLLLERGEIGCQSSGAAAGMLTPVAESVKSQVLRKLGLQSLAEFPNLCAQLLELSGIDADFVASGVLRVAENDSQAQALRQLAATVSSTHPELGLTWLTSEDALGAEPQLTPSQHGALWSPREAHVHSPLLTRAFEGAARALGARIELGVSVQGLLRSGERVAGVRTSAGDRHADHVLLCNGAWAGELVEWLGDQVGVPPLPVAPVRGQILALDATSPPIAAIIWGSDTYLVPKRDGSVMVGTTEEWVGFDCKTTAEGIAGLLSAAPELVPALARARFRKAWAGLRPGSPDGLPAIAAIESAPGLVVAVGHFRTGFLLAPVTARLLSDIVLGKATPSELADFDPKRWA